MRLSEHGKHLDDIFMFLPSKMAFYCVTKSREPTTNESDMLSAFVCTLFVSVDDSCCEYFLINVKSKLFEVFRNFSWPHFALPPGGLFYCSMILRSIAATLKS